MVPTELTERHRSLTDYFFRIHRAYRRCASYDRRHRIDCLCSVTEVKHGLPPIAAQAFISVDSCLAKRRPFCGFEKLKPVRLLCFSVSSVGTTPQAIRTTPQAIRTANRDTVSIEHISRKPTSSAQTAWATSASCA